MRTMQRRLSLTNSTPVTDAASNLSTLPRELLLP
jgi:hypothetical protein